MAGCTITHVVCKCFYVIANRPPFCFAAGSWVVLGKKKHCFFKFGVGNNFFDLLNVHMEVWFVVFDCHWKSSPKSCCSQLSRRWMGCFINLRWNTLILLMDLWEEEFMHLLVVFCLIAFFFLSPNCSTSPRNVTVPSIPYVSKAQVFGFYSVLRGSFQGPSGY